VPGGLVMARQQQKRRPTAYEEVQRGLTRFVWRFEGKKYRTDSQQDRDEAFADAQQQITEQMKGTWQDRSGRNLTLEKWIDTWKGVIDVGPKTEEKYKYYIEWHILPQFQGREIGSLTFEEIEAWEREIPKRISARGRPYAPSVAKGARSLLITILGDAVQTGKIERNPAERLKGHRGRVQAKGRRASAQSAPGSGKVLTPLQVVCIAERCALLSGQDTDFVMNVFAAWNGTRWGELIAVEGWDGKDSPLQLPETGIATYALDWQLLDLGGVLEKALPKDGSVRRLDQPPFLAALLRWAVDNRHQSCACPQDNGVPACKGEDATPANYLFLGPRSGHPRGSNYAEDFITPAAEGLHVARNGIRRPVYTTAEPWPGIPVRKGNRKHTAADLADGTWPDLAGHVKPHDYRHTHSTWLDESDVPKVLQMDRRGHALSGMDATYLHVTDDMRRKLSNYLQGLWNTAIEQRYAMAPRSAVPLLDQILIDHENSLEPKKAQAEATRSHTQAPEVLSRARRQQASRQARDR
jgi:hypothetical protein